VPLFMNIFELRESYIGINEREFVVLSNLLGDYEEIYI
jgi:hypothetical protein